MGWLRAGRKELATPNPNRPPPPPVGKGPPGESPRVRRCPLMGSSRGEVSLGSTPRPSCFTVPLLAEFLQENHPGGSRSRAWRSESPFKEGRLGRRFVPLAGLEPAPSLNRPRMGPVQRMEPASLRVARSRVRSSWLGWMEMERATRIELAFSAWEADVLPLNYARENHATLSTGKTRLPTACAWPADPRTRFGCCTPRGCCDSVAVLHGPSSSRLSYQF